jgi:hypothetical protein
VSLAALNIIPAAHAVPSGRAMTAVRPLGAAVAGGSTAAQVDPSKCRMSGPKAPFSDCWVLTAQTLSGPAQATSLSHACPTTGVSVGAQAWPS